MEIFSPATRLWFEQNFAAPTEPQALGWPIIAAGRHCLITAPTGSGKTLAAFLWSIDRLMRPQGAEPGRDATAPSTPGPRVLYISPLKALVYDIERNLRAPLAGVARAAQVLGEPVELPAVAMRTGDTPQRERQRQWREPAEILVTTPESLYLLLGSRFSGNFRGVHTVIVDEVHALVATKRGAHLSLSLERLATLCERDPQRIGLSATVRPLAEAALYLGGDRPVEIVDAAAPPRLDLQVCVPVPDMDRPPPPAPQDGASDAKGGPILGALYSRALARPPAERGIWSALYPALLEAIAAQGSTICFVNSRGLCERLCQRLNDLAQPQGYDSGLGAPATSVPEPLVLAHHGSVSQEQRARIEESLKRGKLKAIVATSSLELGVDMGAVDQVLLVESPGSVARGLQRVGRAGHGVGQESRGRIYPKFRGDLLECAVIGARMLAGELEALRMPRNALDVLAQQVAAHCVGADRSVDDVLALVTRAGPYRSLSRGALESVLDMLSGLYPSSDFAELRPLLVWDRATDRLSARPGTALIARLNAGTIPDRGHYAVHLGAEGPRLGELDEEMVFETKSGDCVLLGASTWRVEEITRDRVIVSPAPGEPGRLPFWRGEGPGRPVELGRALGAFCRQAAAQAPGHRAAWIAGQTPLDPLAAANLAAYIQGQSESTGLVPSDRTIVIERFRDELGDWRICILSPFGAPIHGPWALALQARLGQREGFEVQVMYTDDGLVLRLADGEDLPALDDLLPDPEDLADLVTGQLAETALFAGLFRENATRALLLPRRSAKGRQPLWAQRLRAQTLLASVRRYPAFPIVIETYRQALGDIFDLAGLRDLLTAIQSRSIRVHEVETRHASPFARSLVFAYVAAYLYEQDAPLAVRRAQALTLDRGLLAELLGQAELRELIDPVVLAELESELQQCAQDRQAQDLHQLHDLLRRLGDLSEAEIAERCRCWPADAGNAPQTPTGRAADAGPLAWLGELVRQRRAVSIRVAGEPRWIAAEDAGLYRDALGAVPPPGLPESFIAPSQAPFEQLLRRYARTHGPFLTGEAAARFGLAPAQVEPVLRLLETQGVLVLGELRPAGLVPEWCDAQVLTRLRRRTMARARNAVAAVDGATLGRFLPLWQGVGEGLAGTERLLEAVGRLAGLCLPWSLVERVLLPARVAGLKPQDLDLLAATGQVCWVGRGALGPRDGRVALYLRQALDTLVPNEALAPEALDAGQHQPLQEALLARLGRGACFLMDLMQAAERAGLPARGIDFDAALWELVWSGHITNDTFAPLRGLGGGTGRRRGREPALAGGRWSLVADLVGDRVGVTDTGRTLACARLLLDRYGVVSREAVQAEGLAGGFGPIYRVLRQMEEAGRVRRGHFVEGLSGAQFALPGALERLRAARQEDTPVAGYTAEAVCLLAALDPANPYGTLLPWPETGAGADAGPPRRVAGAWTILVAGRPVLYVAAGGRALTSFPESITAVGGELALALGVLGRLSGQGARRLSIRHIDGLPALESPLREALLAAGFETDYDALVPPLGGLTRSGQGRGPADSSRGEARPRSL